MGYTLLEGVNHILRSIGHPNASQVDPLGSTGSSMHAQAQAMLEAATKTVLERGHRCNTAENKKYTLGSPGQITFASGVCRVEPTGPTARRNITIRGNSAYDAENDTTTFAAGDYFFHVISWIPFADVEAGTQQIIMEEAARRFQQQHVNNPQRDANIAESQAKAEVTAPRIVPPRSNMAANQVPLIPAQQQ